MLSQFISPQNDDLLDERNSSHPITNTNSIKNCAKNN